MFTGYFFTNVLVWAVKQPWTFEPFETRKVHEKVFFLSVYRSHCHIITHVAVSMNGRLLSSPLFTLSLNMGKTIVKVKYLLASMTFLCYSCVVLVSILFFEEKINSQRSHSLLCVLSAVCDSSCSWWLRKSTYHPAKLVTDTGLKLLFLSKKQKPECGNIQHSIAPRNTPINARHTSSDWPLKTFPYEKFCEKFWQKHQRILWSNRRHKNWLRVCNTIIGCGRRLCVPTSKFWSLGSTSWRGCA